MIGDHRSDRAGATGDQQRPDPAVSWASAAGAATAKTLPAPEQGGGEQATDVASSTADPGRTSRLRGFRLSVGARAGCPSVSSSRPPPDHAESCCGTRFCQPGGCLSPVTVPAGRGKSWARPPRSTRTTARTGAAGSAGRVPAPPELPCSPPWCGACTVGLPARLSPPLPDQERAGRTTADQAERLQGQGTLQNDARTTLLQGLAPGSCSRVLAPC
jgi:hypothetical protein